MFVFQKVFFRFLPLILSLQVCELCASPGDADVEMGLRAGAGHGRLQFHFERALTAREWYDGAIGSGELPRFIGVKDLLKPEAHGAEVIVCIAVGPTRASFPDLEHTAMFCASRDDADRALPDHVRVDKVHACEFYAAPFLRTVRRAYAAAAAEEMLPSALATCYNWIGNPEIREWPEEDRNLWVKFSERRLTFREIGDRSAVVEEGNPLKRMYEYIVTNFSESDFKREICVSHPDQDTDIRNSKYTFLPSTMFLTSRDNVRRVLLRISESIARFGDPTHTLLMEGCEYRLYQGIGGNNCDAFVSDIWKDIETDEILARITSPSRSRLPFVRRALSDPAAGSVRRGVARAVDYSPWCFSDILDSILGLFRR